MQFTQKNPKKPKKKLLFFCCNTCDFESSHKNDYIRHLNTIKHLSNGQQSILPKKTQINCYQCRCGKQYLDNSGLWRHKKKCIEGKESLEESLEELTASVDEIPTTTKCKDDIICTIMKQNADLIDIVKETMLVFKHGASIINTTNNSHNKTFNLQFFLNETCKDAMNIMDFVDSIKLQLIDLENMGQTGFVTGISDIIVKHLNSLDETKRPVHCTDTKREVMYVKDDDKWGKELEDKQKIRKAIKHVAQKNSKMLNEFKAQHPDCDRSESKFSDKYNMLIIEAMGGRGDNDIEKEDKIIRNISKSVTIEKV